MFVSTLFLIWLLEIAISDQTDQFLKHTFSGQCHRLICVALLSLSGIYIRSIFCKPRANILQVVVLIRVRMSGNYQMGRTQKSTTCSVLMKEVHHPSSMCSPFHFSYSKKSDLFFFLSLSFITKALYKNLPSNNPKV